MPFGGGGEPCTLCSKTVYPAEKLKTSTDNVYHQKCFSCTKCKRGLQVSTYCEDAVTGRLYCKVHYEQMAKAAGIDAVARGVTPALHSFPYTNEPAHIGQSRAMCLSTEHAGADHMASRITASMTFNIGISVQ
jgi:hypothetical protein